MHSPESEIPPINKPEATNESQGVVRIPLIITNRMEADLRGRGYRQEEIDRMKPEEAHAILNQKEKERIVSAIEDELDSVGVRSLAHKRTIKLVMAECELALMRAHSSAPKDEKGAILPESQAFLRQEYSRIIAEADKKILGLINRVRSKEKLVALPPLVAERLSRLSKTDAEQAEFNEALRLLAERDRRSVRTSPPAPVAKPAEVGENKGTTMSRESSPAGPEKKEVRPTIEELGLSQKTQELINAVLTLCQKEATEQIASAKTIKDPGIQRRIIEGWYNDAGSMVEKYIREDFEKRGKRLPEDFRFPKEYVDRLPGRAYLYEGKSLDELSEDGAESVPDRGSGREEHRKGGVSRSRPDSKEAKIKVEAPFDEARPLDNPAFVQFLIDRYAEPADALTQEEMVARVEAFKQYREQVKEIADFFVDRLAQEGVVKITSEISNEIRLALELHFASQLKNDPEMVGRLVQMIDNYKNAPAIIEVKERTLAELGNQDENREKRGELVEARRKREALQSEYGKGIFRSFFAGFWRGIRGQDAPQNSPHESEADADERNFAGRVWDKVKRGVGRGWRVGREAALRSQGAARELNEKGFRKLTEALDAGELDELEKKIRKAEDAERIKRDTAEMFAQAREVIFEGIGELSSVAEKMRRQTREVFARMVGDEKATIESLQISFDTLSAARKRIEGNDELIGLTPEDIDRTIGELDRLIEAQFVKDIERAITEGFTKDRPFSFLVKMLGKYARLERLGSKHSKEVREFFEEVVGDYSASGRDIDPAKRLMLRQLITALEGEEGAGEGVPTRGVEHATDSSEAAKSAEKEKGKVLVPGVGDEFEFRFKDGDKEYVDKNAKITKVYFKSKDAPRPSEKLRVEGHYRKNGKMKRYNSVITYAQYIVLKKKTQEGGAVMKGEKVRTERGGEGPKVKNETSTGRPSVKDESREPRVDKAQPETPVEAPLEEKRESEQFYNLEEAASVTQLRPDQLQRILEAWRIRADYRKSGDYEIRFERRVIDRIARIRQVIREMPDRAEFYNFDQAVKLLGIEPERMRSLIEDGDVRTFREGADPKFKVNEINGLAGIADPYIQEILKQGLEK